MATHEVPQAVRAGSRWDAALVCYITPDGRAWAYTDDPSLEGVSWRDGHGEPIAVAVWLR